MLASFAVSALCLAGFAQAQVGLRLRTLGETIPGLGEITKFGSVFVGESGQVLWKGEALDLPGSTGYLREFLALDDDILAIQGQALPQLGGAVVQAVVGGRLLGSAGYAMRLGIADPGGTIKAIVGPGGYIVRRGDPVLAPGWPAGTEWGSLRLMQANTANQLLLRGTFEVPGQPNPSVLVRMDLDASGNRLAERVIALGSMTLPGGGIIDQLSTDRKHFALGANGDVLWTGSGLGQFSVVLNSTLLFKRGDAVGNGTWSSLTAVGLNDTGRWAAIGGADPSQDTWPDTLVRDGSVIHQYGDTLPHFPSQSLVRMSRLVPSIDNQGRVLWAGDGDAGDFQDLAFYRGDELLAYEGDSVGGSDFELFSDNATDASRNGRFVVATLRSLGDDPYQVLVDLELGFEVCAGSPNSTGVGASLVAEGFASLKDDSLVLRSQGLPAGNPAIVLLGTAQGSLPLGQGTLCLDGANYRIPGSLASIPASGELSFQPDIGGLPLGLVPSAGETRYFQVWYRDQNPISTSNLSAAIGVAFYN